MSSFRTLFLRASTHQRRQQTNHFCYPYVGIAIVMATVVLLYASHWAQAEDRSAPPTSRSEVVDTFHGTTVVDPYRWLEDTDDPAVQQWTKAQNQYATDYLKSLPNQEEIREQVTDILSAETVSYGSISYHGGQFFALKRQPPKQQPFVISFESLDTVADARVVFDPNQMDSAGKVSIDWFKVSPDGKLVALSLSRSGSESGDLHLFDTQTGEKLDLTIEHVNSGTAGGSLAWTPQGDAFYYTRHFQVNPDTQDTRVYQQVYLHRMDESTDADVYQLGEGFPQIAEIQLDVDHSTGDVLATVQRGDGGEFAHYLKRHGENTWTQFSQFGDKHVQALFGKDPSVLYVVSLKDAKRGKLLRVQRDQLDLSTATTVVEETEDTIVTGGVAFWGESTVVPTETRLYIVYQLGGPSELRVFDKQGTLLATPRQLEVGSVHNVVPLGDDDVIFGNTSFIQPDAYYYYDARSHNTYTTAVADESAVELDDVVVTRQFARSEDGTRIPLNIIMRKGTQQTGENPCVVTGYGGYGVNIQPGFRPLLRVYLDHGFVYVVTNLRGGGEYGESWHREGNLTDKQNVFDDFAACIRYMIHHNYTRPRRLGVIGGSNGGLLMGATLVQNPELLGAVVALVGIYDMLRVELSPNGAFNVTEFGTVKNPAHFEALYSYSPYHNVVDGVRYPPVLLITGANDPRVDPMQSRKMAARLQEATRGDSPVLLRTNMDSGHGVGSSLNERIEQAVEIISFFVAELQVTK